jgi:hypothetical protein
MTPTVAPEVSPSQPERRPDWLRAMRELTTTALAGIVMVGFVTLLVMAVRGVDDPDPAFERLKELIAIGNGIVGVIIGYYFTRTTTESVVEKAEETARSASDAATAAKDGQARMERQVDEAEQAGQELAAAAKDFLDAVPEVRSDEGSLRTPQVARARLETALRRYG